MIKIKVISVSGKPAELYKIVYTCEGTERIGITNVHGECKFD